jgi:hypothetical protein
LKTTSKVRILGATGALVALAAVTAGGPASAGAKGLVGASIKIKGNKNPHFVAPETVAADQDLQIVNRTDPGEIGPHTFSLVTKDKLPRTRTQIRKCFHFKLICKDIVTAHEVGPPPDFPVGVPNVENGAEGWDASFDGDDFGDTWFTGEEDETTSRQVTAEGGKLFFLCAVHPFMQGKVKVVTEAR